MIDLRWCAALAVLLLPVLQPGPAAKPRAESPGRFVDVTAAAGITFVHASGASPDKHMVETFGSV